ncbi:MAG: capsular biosynthesis protein CpsI, partial [Thermodesulfobacteriota bacterium]|nr:capsular biosynthesis protein CpsI [Thermodesulfobacteriota bacterium]
VVRIMERIPVPDPAWHGDSPDPGSSYARYRIYNIGNNHPVSLTDFIAAIEKALGKKAKKELLPMQPGDVPATYADIDDLIRDAGFKPATPLAEGITRFIKWYREYYQE